MRPCWSADPPDMLMTATAPLCNQGIHSHFCPASVSFFVMERPTREPCQLPVSAPWPPRWAWWADGLAGGWTREEGGVVSPSPGLQCTQCTWGVPICLPQPHSGNPFPEKEGQGFPECFLWLLPPFILWGARAVPGLDVAMGTSDLVHGERSGGTGPGEAGPGGFCPQPHACGVSVGPVSLMPG